MDDQYAVLDGPHIEGFVTPTDYVRVPLASHIEGNLWMGGCKDGVRLPDDFSFVLSLYPWERYELGPDTDREEVRLYDSADVPPVDQLLSLAKLVNRKQQHGKVLVHCQAGLNRSGLISALSMILGGDAPAAAIQLLRERRSKHVLCNRAFHDWLLAYEREEAAA